MAGKTKQSFTTSLHGHTGLQKLISPEAVFKNILDKRSLRNQNLEQLLQNTFSYLKGHFNFETIQFIYHDKGVPYAVSQKLTSNEPIRNTRVALNEFHRLLKKSKSTKYAAHVINNENEKIISALGYFLIYPFQLPSTNLLFICSNNSFLPFDESEAKKFQMFCLTFFNILKSQNELRLDLKKKDLLEKLISFFPVPLVKVDGQVKSKINADSLLADIGHHKKLSLLGDLTNTLAHELSNPLFGISLCASTLHSTQEDYNEVIAQISKSSQRCVNIINQLKNIYTINQEPKSISLREIVIEACTIAKSETKGITLSKEFFHSNEHDLLRTNPTFLHQILFNLIINAAQALKQSSRHQGTIRVVTEFNNQEYIITVSDNGGGIDPQLESELLRPFFSTKKGGTGLGLSICSRLVHKIGGTLNIVNRYPDGLEAIIRIRK